MEKVFMPNETPEERLKILESQANFITKDKYFVRLEEEELVNARAAFTKNRLAMDDLEEQKKDVLSEIKEEMKPLKEIHKELSSEIRRGFREQEGRLFAFLEQEQIFFIILKKTKNESKDNHRTTRQS
jgi:hypothetical protein